MQKIISCDKCDGRCCRDVTVEIDKPTSFGDFEDLKWMIAHQNVYVYLDEENDWVVEFRTPCNFLDDKNRCSIYKRRYKMCSDHDPEACIINGEGKHYKIFFKTEKDVDKYMKKIGYYERYMRMKKKQLSKK